MRIVICILLFGLVNSIWAQDKTYTSKKVPRNTVLIPEEGILMDQFEVSCGEWFYFIYKEKIISGYTEEEILSYLPNREAVSKVVQPLLDEFEKLLLDGELQGGGLYFVSDVKGNPFPWVDPKLSEVDFDLFKLPVTGVTFDQVEEFLSFLEREISESRLGEKYHKDGWELRVMLPDPELRTRIGQISSLNAEGNRVVQPDTMNASGCYLMNIKYQSGCEFMEEMAENYGDEVFPGAMFFPSIHGLYDFFGNVSEMTSTPGIAMGGSFNHWGRLAFPEVYQEYIKPEKWLGFRCIYKWIKK